MNITYNVLFSTSWGIYLVPKELNYTAVFLSINNESQCVPLLFCRQDLWHRLHLLF